MVTPPTLLTNPFDPHTIGKEDDTTYAAADQPPASGDKEASAKIKVNWRNKEKRQEYGKAPESGGMGLGVHALEVGALSAEEKAREELRVAEEEGRVVPPAAKEKSVKERVTDGKAKVAAKVEEAVKDGKGKVEEFVKRTHNRAEKDAKDGKVQNEKVVEVVKEAVVNAEKVGSQVVKDSVEAAAKVERKVEEGVKASAAKVEKVGKRAVEGVKEIKAEVEKKAVEGVKQIKVEAEKKAVKGVEEIKAEGEKKVKPAAGDKVEVVKGVVVEMEKKIEEGVKGAAAAEKRAVEAVKVAVEKKQADVVAEGKAGAAVKEGLAKVEKVAGVAKVEVVEGVAKVVEHGKEVLGAVEGDAVMEEKVTKQDVVSRAKDKFAAWAGACVLWRCVPDDVLSLFKRLKYPPPPPFGRGSRYVGGWVVRVFELK